MCGRVVLLGLRGAWLHDGAIHGAARGRCAGGAAAPRSLRRVVPRPLSQRSGAAGGRDEPGIGKGMNIDQTVGVIGAGAMGEALIKGLVVTAGVVERDHVTASAPRGERLALLAERY